MDIPRENTRLVKKQVKHMFAYVFCLQWCRCSGRSAPCQVCCKPNRKATDLKNAAFRELRESIKPYGGKFCVFVLRFQVLENQLNPSSSENVRP